MKVNFQLTSNCLIVLLCKNILFVLGRSVGDRFDLAKSSLHHCLVRVLHVLNEIAPIVIKWPEPGEMNNL